MKAIIIEEERFGELCELLKLKAESVGNDSSTPERCGWERQMWRAAVDEAHRTLHYHFVRWAQSHGASCR